MKYRKLGKTGISISGVGFGCGNVGGIIIRQPNQVRLQAVRRALESGINYFDTAPQYGQGQSELNLGQLLKELHANPFVATKVRLKNEDLGNINKVINDSLNNSLKRLQRDYVDVLLLHNPVCARRGNRRDSVTVEDVLGAGGILQAMGNIKAQGKARFLGFTGLGDTDVLHSLVKTGRFDVFQCYYNILNPSAAEEVKPGFSAQDYKGLMKVAASAGMGILGIRIMAAGALSNEPPTRASENTMSPGSEYDSDISKGKGLESLVGGNVESIQELAFRYALSNKQLSCLLIGFAELQHIEQSVAWVDKGPLPISMMEKIREMREKKL